MLHQISDLGVGLKKVGSPEELLYGGSMEHLTHRSDLAFPAILARDCVRPAPGSLIIRLRAQKVFGR